MTSKMKPLILPPRIDSFLSHEALFVIICGAFNSPESYKPLGSVVQEFSDLKLWVGILHFKDYAPCEEDELSQFNILKLELETRGFKVIPKETKVFFCGHSLGGPVCDASALKLSDGFILLGSRLNPSRNSLKEFPIPILSITGQYDGQLPLPVAAVAAGEVKTLEKQLGESYMSTHKCTIVIEGMNHAQFGDGVVDSERGDWNARISAEVARAQVARLISAFIGFHCTAGKRGESKLLLDSFLKSEVFLRPFWEAHKTQNEGWEDVQDALLNLAWKRRGHKFPISTEMLWHSFEDNFLLSKPWIDSERNKVIGQGFLKQQSFKYAQSSNLWVKLIHPDAFHEKLILPSQGEGHGNFKKLVRTLSLTRSRSRRLVTSANKEAQTEARTVSLLEYFPFFRAAAEINRRNFSKAVSLICSEHLKRYEAEGKKLRFVADLVCSSEEEWNSKDVLFLPSSEFQEVVNVQSPVVITEVDRCLPQGSKGMYTYCLKVITVARAMEWIMVESFC